MVMTEQGDELKEEIDKEITKAYIGGLVDGRATITVRVAKSSSYKLGYNLEPLIKLSKSKPYSIQVVDDWTAKNGIYASVKQTETGYRIVMNRQRDITKFLELLYPYVQDKMEVFEIMLEDVMPALERGDHLSDKEGFISVVEDIDRLREHTEGRGASKYTAEYFKDEWNIN